MADRLKGKVTIVTGATRGIGTGIARAFIGEGASVLFTGRDMEVGRTIEKELGKNARFMAVNVAQESEIATMVSTAVDTFGGLDCLVSNAGGGIAAGAVTNLITDKFWETFHVLVGGVAYGMKYAAPEIAKRGGGSIINISSIGAIAAGYGGYAYSGAKAGMLQLSKWAAMNLAPTRVRVNVISPGPILTAIFARGGGADPSSAESAMTKLAAVFEDITPLHLAGKPEDIGHAAVFLASDESRYVTGHNLVVDGGISNSQTAEDNAAVWTRIRGAVMP